ncbi:lipid II flippase MurJ [uncultured Desulfobacter sp.]|uniref:lipid II flippase MurJ n=1 Tax=uncultured Desulfobacter sp. TaxID=240139 RepID=UPI0029F49422|nr:lipid II flippase MurJ [uncultured Desulfobacter sp.]
MTHFIKKAASISSITLISRILGMIRDAVIAFIFGASTVSDAFFIAFRPFDLIRKMMSDGILSISFIPLFAAQFAQNKKKQAVAMFLNALFIISIVGALLVGLGIYFAPFLIDFFAPGYGAGSYSHKLSCLLFRIMTPYMAIIFFVALSMSVLHATGNFYVPAATPILLNFCIITAAVLFADRFTPKIIILAIGVTVGGIVQLAIQLPSLAKLGMFDFKSFVRVHSQVKKAFIALGPSMIGAASFQINLLVAGLTASTLDPGAVSYLNYAERLVQFPLARCHGFITHALRNGRVLLSQT